ncbi:NAD(P)H-dependent flavin oxidoreductase [Nocardioides mesophilus]|uniref:Nitronate monooxygenase n=1 Tax=Nocardioides mesophilus TaxID=433659 RepID=A0A7G9RCD9_9ACTN|nr:nitronate monooxygenase [Nocardioides mesophilus]QNN53264.1 nitronate monooxygenase [Nocardioides mesophilus]
MNTWLTATLGIEVPLVQAPMARVTDGRFAAAVSAAGALGMLAVGPGATADWVTEQAGAAASAGRPFGIGLMAWALEHDPAPLQAAADSDAALVSVSFGALEEPVRRLRAAGKLVSTQVGNLEEARRAESAGVDLVVARGGEAGGHGRNDVGTLPLLQMVLDVVTVPVLAAGGVMNARGLAAVLAAGAAGAWAGTAFLTCRESGFPAGSRARLVAAGDTDTAYGRVFDVAQRAAWPREYGGRALRNAFFQAWVGREDELAADVDAMERYAEASRREDYDIAVIYAGQGAGLLDEETCVADVVAEFARAEELLRRVR